MYSKSVFKSAKGAVIEENMPSVRDEVSEEWKDKLGVKVVPPLFLSNFCFFTSTKLSCLFPTKMMDESFDAMTVILAE